MIKLKLSFGEDHSQSIEIKEGETLKAAVARAFQGAPMNIKPDEDMNVVVNGKIIEPGLWQSVRLKPEDEIQISPKIKDGDAGQIFKMALIIGVTIVANAIAPGLGIAAGTWTGVFVAGVTIAASLALNALIPPPTQEMGGLDGLGGSDVESSQMYSITGQSNAMKRLGIVPKVYGSHRMFPNVAANPYVELKVNPANGEVVQYLVGIYDFGLGTPQVFDLKVGDTPISNDSLEDFEYRFVDPNLPEGPAQDQYDLTLNREFKIYKGDRSAQALSLALEDGSETIQNTDPNPEGLQQEIILDMVCPNGLFSYSSSGTLGERRVNLNIDFAPVGSSDWKPYNDITAVDHFESVGGTDRVNFKTPLVNLNLSHPLFNSYYYGHGEVAGNFAGNANYYESVASLGRSAYLVYDPEVAGESFRWEVGATVFYNEIFLGIVVSATNLGPTYPDYMSIQLDRVNPGFSVCDWFGNRAYDGGYNLGPIVYTESRGSASIKSSRHTASAASIIGSRQSGVFASFRFTPKIPGQYQVRVRRTSSEGEGSQTADALTWNGLTTVYNRAAINTDKRHVFLELKIRATNQLNGNIQNLSGLTSQVLPVYDPDTDTWTRQFTSNPAWIFCDLLTGEVNKKAVDRSRLHLDSILEWADYCAEIPTPPPGTTNLEPRFQTNFILDYEATLQSVIQQVCSTAQASLNIIDGNYGVLVDRLKTTPVQIFTPRNSRDFSSSRLYGVRPHAVKVKYIDPDKAWELQEVTVYDNGYTEDNATIFDDLTAFACTNHNQAWRFGRYMIAQNKLRMETMSILVDFENLVCTRGDYVQITQDVMEVGGRPARVKTVSGSIFTIDDALDIDSGLDYGYTLRTALGEIETAGLTPLGASTFSATLTKVVFTGQDTTGQTFDAYFRYGGVPPVVGSSRKILGLVGVYAAGDTTYTLPEAPLGSDDFRGWLDGKYRTDYTLVGNVVTFAGQDLTVTGTDQVFDCQYRHAGSASLGTERKVEALTGVFAAGDTTYTLPEAPLSDDDFIGWLNGDMRSDCTLVGNVVTFAGQDTTGQVFDCKYTYMGAVNPVGFAGRVDALTGVYADGNTTYTLPNGPIGSDDIIVNLNGAMRADWFLDGAIPAVGDLIVIGEVGFLTLDCIIKSIAPNDDMSAQITLIERANEIFEYESTDILPEYDPSFSQTSRPDFHPPLAVTDLTLVANTWMCSQTRSGYAYYAEISWNTPPRSVFEFFEIWADDGRGYRAVEKTNAKYFRYEIDQSRLGFPHGLKVVAVAASGKKLNLIEMQTVEFTPVVKSEAPSDVETLGMSITNQTLQLSWPSIADCDVASYELRYSPDTNDIWEASTPLQTVDRNVNSISVQARTGIYFIKAIDFAGNKSANSTQAFTTIPNLFDLNVIEELNDAPTFPGELDLTEMLGEAVILQTRIAGDVEAMEFFSEGSYVISDLVDLGDIYSARLQSLIRADGYRFGELMSSWEHISDVDHLNSTDSDDWNAQLEYRATNEVLAMADWLHLADIEHIGEGSASGFTDWRPIPTIGDATGRVFQFRVKLQSLTPNVTPRLFDATVKVDMPDRVDSFENQLSSAVSWVTITYDNKFNGPGSSPAVHISVDDGATGDYWEFSNKTLEGFDIRFKDKDGNQVARQFDVQAKGYGRRHTVTI